MLEMKQKNGSLLWKEIGERYQFIIGKAYKSREFREQAGYSFTPIEV